MENAWCQPADFLSLVRRLPRATRVPMGVHRFASCLIFSSDCSHPHLLFSFASFFLPQRPILLHYAHNQGPARRCWRHPQPSFSEEMLEAPPLSCAGVRGWIFKVFCNMVVVFATQPLFQELFLQHGRCFRIVSAISKFLQHGSCFCNAAVVSGIASTTRPLFRELFLQRDHCFRIVSAMRPLFLQLVYCFRN